MKHVNPMSLALAYLMLLSEDCNLGSSFYLQTKLASFEKLLQLCWILLKIPKYDSDDKFYLIESLVGFAEWSFNPENN